MSNPKGTTFSDRELATWSTIPRADVAAQFWQKNSIGAPTAAVAMAGELLEARRILRDFIARHEETTQDPLVLRAVDLLGFNLEPSQPLFPSWPSSPENAVKREGGSK